ncbi:MAG: penicillin-binding protein [Ruminococcaceae bacterium]|nr:penicillin-binding protein [Oscillospiraceae bacterium]
MHKLKNRALLALLLVGCLVAALGFYGWFYVRDGGDWVAFASNRHIYKSGSLQTGTITDREGTVLASTDDGKRAYHDDAAVRTALLHLIGDPGGSIGTGAQIKFADRLTGFSHIDGLYHASHSDASLTLTVDAPACAAAYRALGDFAGAAIVYNYQTGEILCSVSTPAFDPANVPDNLRTDSRWDGVYVNRVYQAAYAPGSVMKVITTAAAIEQLPHLFDMRFNCPGSIKVGSTTINCMHTHGEIAVGTALAKSCNVAFAELALTLGGETLKDYCERFGLLESLSIDGIPSAAGRFDAAADGTAALAWSGIGQSTNLVSPINIALVMGAIGGDGETALPRLLMDSAPETRRLMKQETAETLTRMMRYNVTSVYGTDRFPEELREGLCAKSGTAEVDGAEPHAWFAGFVDDEQYPYAFAVIAEHGGAGSETAAGIAAAVLGALVD